jgi:hypothetical protein
MQRTGTHNARVPDIISTCSTGGPLVKKSYHRLGAQRREALSLTMLMVMIASVIALFVVSCGPSSGAPDLTGLTSDVATKRAASAGLSLVTKQEVACFLPAGTVLSQDPLPGGKSTDGTIQVTVGRAPIPVAITSVEAYDPDGNGAENNDQVRYLTDGDLSTSWSTEKTYKSPDFQGLGSKTGVGLKFRLAEGATMLKITYSQTGWKGEVQEVLSGLPIAIAPLGSSQQVSWRKPISSGRIWLYYLATLPLSEDGIQRYGVEIDEIAFYK